MGENELIAPDDIELSHVLTGFHSFVKDHNYGNFKGDLINEISDYLNITIDATRLPDGIDYLLSQQKSEKFMIQLSPNMIIYQDNLSLDKLAQNAAGLLNIWKSHSKLISLKLMGIVFYFSIDMSNRNESHIKRYFSTFQIGDFKQIGLSFVTTKNIAGQNYNIKVEINEFLNDKHKVAGNVDFNYSSKNKSEPIPDDFWEEIQKTSHQFFNNNFISFLNSGEL